MSKLSQVLLGCALPLLLVGGVSAFAGWNMGAESTLDLRWRGHEVSISPFNIRGWNTGRDAGRGDWEGRSLGTGELAAFQRLEVDLDVGDLMVQTGDALSLDLYWYGTDYALHTSDEGGLLKVWSTGSTNYSGSNLRDAEVVLTLPEGTALREVSVNSDVGDIDLFGLEIGTLTVDADVGDVTMTSVVLGAADLDLDVGSLTAELRGLTDRLSVACDVGDIDVYGVLTGNLDLRADLGSVSVSTDGARTSYRWDLNTGMGGVWMDGMELEQERAQGGSGEYAMTVRTGMGDVDVMFGGESGAS